MDFDKWAYIPNKAHKRITNNRIKTTVDASYDE